MQTAVVLFSRKNGKFEELISFAGKLLQDTGEISKSAAARVQTKRLCKINLAILSGKGNIVS